MRTKLFTVLIIILVLTSLSISQTNIPPGDVSGTWTAADSIYFIQGDIQIPNDSTLNIEAGVTVEFQGHYSLKVQGRLLAMGTAIDSVIFTTNDTTGFSNPDTSLGSWGGIRFIDTPLQNDSSKLIFCKLQYGKAVYADQPDNSGGAIFISNFNKVKISNCLITHNSAGGLNSPSGGGLVLAFANIILEENEISFNRAWDGGGIQIWESDPVFRNNRIISNHADTGGGGVWIGGLSNPEFIGDTISNNVAAGNGGGMICWQTTSTSLNSVNILHNSSDWGGGIGIFGCEMQINDCNISDNSAINLGGGIASDFGMLHLNNNIFERDSAGSQSGAIHSWHSNIVADQCQFRNNLSSLGGGIHGEFSTLEFNNSTFSRNSAFDGAGIHTTSSHLSIDSCNFSQNIADNAGAALQYTADTLDFTIPYLVELTNSTFSLNYATNLVGGVNINQVNSDSSLVNLLIENCIFTNNTADHVSALRIIGGIGDFTILNSTFSGNNANRWAAGANFVSKCKGKVINCLFNSNQANIAGSNSSSGGAGVTQESEIEFFNCTFSNNSAAAGSGLHVRSGGIVNIINCIFWDNIDQQINLVTIDNRISSVTINNCDIQHGMDSINVDSLSLLHWGQGNIDSQPYFANPLSADFHLQEFSPCIGSGVDSLEISGTWYVAPTFDLEGNPRPNPVGSMPDMGVYESALAVPTAINETDNLIPLQFALKQNYPNPFNPTTTIEFDIPKLSFVQLKLFDVLGRKIRNLVSDLRTAGKYKYVLDGSDLASGLYFIQFQAGDFKAIRKVLLVQ